MTESVQTNAGAKKAFDPSSYVYLDYAARAPLCYEALLAMEPHMQAEREGIAHFANANSLSAPGRAAFKALEEARRSLAKTIGARRSDEVIFTSGATEADNAALYGLVAGTCSHHVPVSVLSGEVIVSALEHDAVLACAQQLSRLGVSVTYVKPDRDGFIEVRKLEEAITDHTTLVSIQLANSEVGSIQPIKQLAECAHAKGALFHCDATQALGKIPVDMQALGVDAASFSSHKVGGPPGVGALYLRAHTPFVPFMVGGGQESGRRSGTQNVAGAVGFAAAACASTGNLEEEGERLRFLRDKLYADLATFDAIQPTVEVEHDSLDYLPNIVNVLIRGIESETAVIRLDALGFAVSGGSACASRTLDPSHVLTAMGISSKEARGELRISMGRYTTQEDINAFLGAIPSMLAWEKRRS